MLCSYTIRARRSQDSHTTRIFWSLMLAGTSLWLTAQLLWSILEIVYRKPVPNPFAGDIVLFLHLVPFMAMLVLRPDERRSQRYYLDLVNFGMLFVWWVYLYLFIVIPWQYVRLNSAIYSENFDKLYLVEHAVLVCSAIYVWSRSGGSWKRAYAQFVGASVLYAFSSIAGSVAITRNEYYTGSVFDVPLVAAELWFCIVPLLGEHLHAPGEEDDSSPAEHRRVLPWAAKLVVLSMPAFAGWAFFLSQAPAAVDRFRVILTLVTTLVLIGCIGLRQVLVDSELVSLIDAQEKAIVEMERLQRHLVQSEKLSSLSSVVGPSAQDIKVPIRSVISCCESLVETRKLGANEKTLAEKIASQAQRMLGITEQLLSFGQPGVSKKNVVNLNSLVSLALKLCHPQFCTKNITLETRLPESPVWIDADSNQIITVFISIIQNATDAMSGAGGMLEVQIKEQNGFGIIDFLDDGHGIKEPLRIFDPFYTTKPVGKGVGLGLSASYGIIQEHGGRITGENRQNKGAIFRIELPATNAPANPRQSHTKLQAIS
jgi:signal transduction histidine kinase